MRILVTGSSGFIGSHLVERLERNGNTVMQWDKKIGLNIKEILSLKNIDFVIHLAAIADVRRSIEFPDEYWENNVEYTKSLQDLCHEENVPLIYASSSCATSWSKSPYGTSKKVNELTAHKGQVGLRFTTVYGARCRESMFISKLMRGELTYSTDHIRDFIHVNDVVRAITIIKEEMEKGTELDPWYNVGTGKGNKVCDIARIKMNVKVKPGNDCEALDNTANIEPLSKLGWLPEIDVKEYVADKKSLLDFPKSIYLDLDSLYNDIEQSN